MIPARLRSKNETVKRFLKNLVMKSVTIGAASAGTALLLSASATFFGVIDVHLSASPLDRQQTGAAVIGVTGDCWNYLAGISTCMLSQEELT